MTEFKPIAMRCNQQQYAEIKQILIDNGFKCSLDGTFTEYPYLTNNYDGSKNNICNCFSENKTNFNRTVFETWNKDIFLEYCGITNKKPELIELPNTWYVQLTEDNFDIVKNWHESLKQGIMYHIGSYYGMCNNKPDAWGKEYLPNNTNVITTEQFKKWVLKESKPEFIVGKWYKYNGCYIKLKCIKNGSFLASDDIVYSRYDGKGGYYGQIDGFKKEYILLTDLSEIQQYLPDGHVDKQNNTLNMYKILEEAKLKYPIGTKFKPIRSTGEISDNIILQEKECYLYKDNENYEWVIGSDNIYNPVINKWAEIIESPKTNTKWKPQIGDYVITKGYTKDYDGRILKITRIDGEFYWFDITDNGYHQPNANFGKYHILRKAEAHEIPKTESLLEKVLHFTPDPFLSLQGIGYETSFFDSLPNKSSKLEQKRQEVLNKFMSTSTGLQFLDEFDDKYPIETNQPTTNNKQSINQLLKVKLN
jgi:hypothetical protein